MESATSFYIEIQNPRLRLNIIMAEESPAGCMFCNCLHVVLRVSDPSAHARFSNGGEGGPCSSTSPCT